MHTFKEWWEKDTIEWLSNENSFLKITIDSARGSKFLNLEILSIGKDL